MWNSLKSSRTRTRSICFWGEGLHLDADSANYLLKCNVHLYESPHFISVYARQQSRVWKSHSTFCFCFWMTESFSQVCQLISSSDLGLLFYSLSNHSAISSLFSSLCYYLQMSVLLHFPSLWMFLHIFTILFFWISHSSHHWSQIYSIFIFCLERTYLYSTLGFS